MPHSNRSARLDALLRSGRLSRRDLLSAAAGLGLVGLLGPGATRAQQAPRFVADPFQLGVASGYPTPEGFSLQRGWRQPRCRPMAASSATR